MIHGRIDKTLVSFAQTDPLPIAKTCVIDSEDALFLIDTGGPELARLDVVPSRSFSPSIRAGVSNRVLMEDLRMLMSDSSLTQ